MTLDWILVHTNKPEMPFDIKQGKRTDAVIIANLTMFWATERQAQAYCNVLNDVAKKARRDKIVICDNCGTPWW